MKKQLPIYNTPIDFICPHCHQPTLIIALDNSFDHEFGTEYPAGYGRSVCDECEGWIEDAEPYEGDY